MKICKIVTANNCNECIFSEFKVSEDGLKIKVACIKLHWVILDVNPLIEISKDCPLQDYPEVK
jgi:hypothetical protein